MKRPFKKNRLFILILGAGLLVSLLVNHIVLQEQEKHENRLFLGMAEERFISLNRTLQQTFDLFGTIRDIVQADIDMDREGFKKYTQSFLIRYPEIKSLAWIPRIEAEKMQYYQQMARVSGLRDFVFHEQNSPILTRKADYYPVYFIEPMRNSRHQLGRELSADPDYWSAMIFSSDNDKISLTAPLNIEENDEQDSVIAFLPVYVHVGERLNHRHIENTAGYVGMQLKLHDFFLAAIYDVFDGEGIKVGLYDQETSIHLAGADLSEDTFYYHEQIIDTGRGIDTEVEYEGRLWVVKAWADKHFASKTSIIQRNQTFIIGALISLLAAFYVFKNRAQQEIINEVNYLAHHDSLTGLSNRFSLEDRLFQSISQAKRNEAMLAVLFLDMDRFKNINDTLGHQAGDEMLKQVASRLQFCVRRQTDIIARLGGDEFVVVLSEVEDPKVAALVSVTILHMLSQPYSHNGKDLHSTPSIGISMFPFDGDDYTELLKNADTAMYHAKDKGRNNYQFYRQSMNDEVRSSVELENDLHVAIREKQFAVHYQPKLDSGSGKIIGFEALLRWNHPEKGMIPPLRFIDTAEKTGLITSIGTIVSEQVCRDISEWSFIRDNKLRVAINFSVQQLRSDDCVKQMRDNMQKYDIPSGMLEIEITESVAMHDPATTIERLNQLKELGCHISIDDFGTGYSSLSYLKMLPVNTLKLDRSFVKDIETDENDRSICDATISLAHSLGLTVVAEGVETQEQKDFLVSRQCDMLQGYLISRPLPLETLKVQYGNEPIEGVA
jgi:diguanylate cyclase (GGDEF)-like protein